MFEIKAKDKMVERALLVGAYTDTSKKPEAESLLAELEELVDTLKKMKIVKSVSTNFTTTASR